MDTTVFEKLNYYSTTTINPEECIRLLKIINNNLTKEALNSSSTDLYLYEIFHKTNGLLAFIKNVVPKKEFKNSIGKALEIIYTLVNSLHYKLNKHVLDIQDTCVVVAVSWHTESTQKIKALQTLELCFEKFNKSIEEIDHYSALYDRIYKNIKFNTTTGSTLKEHQFIFLGTFAKKFPFIIQGEHEVLKNAILTLLQTEMAQEKKSQALAGLLIGLSRYLESFPLSPELPKDKEAIDKIYKHILCLSQYPEVRIKIVHRAALEFLADNISLFTGKILKEVKRWHKRLLTWIDNKGVDDEKAGRHALQAFYYGLGKHFEKNPVADKSAIEHFRDYFIFKLTSPATTTLAKHLTLQGIRSFCGAFRLHLGEQEHNRIASLVIRNLEQLYVLKEDPSGEDWEFLPDYLQTVSNFLHQMNLNLNEIFYLQKTSINLIKHFPKLSYSLHELTVDTIVFTLFSLKSNEEQFNLFLEVLTYQGTIWSCSHQHITDSEMVDPNNKKQILTVRSYLPLWLKLLDFPKRRDQFRKFGMDYNCCKEIRNRIIQQLVKNLYTFTSKLNVNVNVKDVDCSSTSIESVYEVDQQNDFDIFLNLVDFYEVLLKNFNPESLQNNITRLINYMIEKCCKFPLISGFCKLLSFSLRISHTLRLFDQSIDEDVSNCLENLTRFFKQLIKKMVHFKDELLIACLQVFLESPTIIVENMLLDCVPVFLTCFNLGRNHIKLAEMSLSTLKHWQNTIKSDTMNELVMKIIPTLDSYLRSKSLGILMQTDVTEKRRKTEQLLKKRRVMRNLEPELILFQKKVLEFLGEQNSIICEHFLLPDHYLSEEHLGASTHMKISLPYDDLKVDLYLDAFVPRLVHLSLFCTDRKTRITCCELLHSVVMIFLGRSKPMSQKGLEELDDLLKHLAMPMLQLGCDIDKVVQQLFQPLVMQLIHWYTCQRQLRSSHTAIIIETLMDGITHPTDSALRDFSGNCINELVKWSIKQSSTAQIKDIPNIKVLVRKMRFFSSHPDPNKKLGAALIFNHTYKELREQDDVISTYWFDIVHIFITSLDQMDVDVDEGLLTQIKHAVSHLQRVFVEKAKMFNDSDASRRVPHDIRGDSLKDLALWLLDRTGSLSKCCRERSMELFCALAPLTKEAKGNLSTFILNQFGGKPYWMEIYEKHIHKSPTLRELKTSSEDSGVLFKWFQALLCSLDGHCFVIKNNLTQVEIKPHMSICKAINTFLKHLQTNEVEEALKLISPKEWPITLYDKEHFMYLKSYCSLLILKLFTLYLNDELLCKKLELFWNIDVWNFILNITFKPEDFHYEFIQDLQEIIKVFFNRFPNKVPKEVVLGLVKVLEDYVHQTIDFSFNFNQNSVSKMNCAKGLSMLQSCSINKYLQRYSDRLKLLLESFCDKEKNDHLVLNDINLKYSKKLLQLTLTSESLDIFLEYFYGAHKISTYESIDQAIGVFLLNNYNEIILNVLANDFHPFLDLSLKKYPVCDVINCLMQVLANFQKQKKFYDYCFGSAYDSLLASWPVFEAFFKENTENINLSLKFIDTVKNLNLNEKPSNEVNQIIQFLIELMKDSLIKKYLDVSEQCFNQLSVLIDEKFEGIDTLSLGLNTLLEVLKTVEKEDQTVRFSKLIIQMDHIRNITLICFLIENVYKFRATIEQDQLKQFITHASIELQQKVLEKVYSYSLKENVSPMEKYRIATEILKPLLVDAHEDCLQQFYDAHIEEITCSLQDNTDEHNVDTKIIYLIAVEVLFLLTDKSNTQNDGKKVLKIIFDAIRTNLVSNKEEVKELYRLYKCHVYNASVSIICNSIEIPQFFTKLFDRKDSNEKDILWHNIINLENEFHFQTEFDSLPKLTKVLVSIRKELRDGPEFSKSNSKTQYLQSVRLFSSSLSEDVCKFDFTSTTLKNPDADAVESTYKTCQSQMYLDSTEINKHPCMATVGALICHIFDSGISDLPEDDDEVMELPPWMEAIRGLLLNSETHKNVKIFFVKIIENLETKVFKKYAKFFIEPLLLFLNDKCAGDEINYFVSDVLTLLADWSKSCPLETQREQDLARNVLSFLITRTTNERNDIFKYNLELIKLMVEAWKDFLPTPFDFILQKLNVDVNDNKIQVGIHLASIILVNKCELLQEQIELLFKLLTKALESNVRAVYRLSSETLGLLLKNLEEDYKDSEYATKLNAILKSMENPDRLVCCLNGVSLHYVNIIDDGHIVRQLDHAYCHLSNPAFLQIVLRRCDILENVSVFEIQTWKSFLESDNLEVVLITMDILLQIIEKLSTLSDFNETVDAICANYKEPNALRRSRMYDLLIVIHSKIDTSDEIKSKCRDVLIQGLIDTEVDIRDKVYMFWSEYADLPKVVPKRFIYILENLYSTKAEDEFLGYSTYLLMSILEETEEFEEIVFEHPLEDCSFEEYTLSTHWRLPNPSAVPLFANTLQSQESSTLVDNSDWNFDQLRATLSTLNFEPTMQANESILVVGSSLDSNSTITDPNTINLSYKYKRGNRFLKDKKKIAQQFAEHEVSKKIVKSEKHLESVKEREKKVKIYRNYRKGDFPDIQIKMSAILKPLQILALYDSEIAKILYTDITKSLISKLEKDFVEKLSQSILHIFSNSDQYNTNLFRTLLDIILLNMEKLTFPPEIITSACQASGLTSIGTLILEEYLTDLPECAPKSAKARPNTVNDSKVIYLVKLAELYKELEEWGMVQTIFLEEMNCKELVKNAILAESQKEWRDAEEYYQKLIETDISNERQDFYYESYFKCFANLGKWSQLPDLIENVVKEDGISVWESLWDGDWNQKKLLPWYIEAHLRNTLFSNKCPFQFLEYLNEALVSNKKEQHLRNFYSEMLCMMNLYQNDVQEASKYMKNYLENFLDEWQFINPQFYNLRQQRVMKLRNIIDIQRFIKLHDLNRNSDEFQAELHQLTSDWEKKAKEVPHSLLSNEIRLLYKWQFINILQLSTSAEDVKKSLSDTKFKLDFGFINNAIELNSFHLARKYLANYQTNNSFEAKLAVCSLIFMQAVNLEPGNKVTKLITAINELNPLFERTQSFSIKISGYMKMFQILSIITETLNDNMDKLDEFRSMIVKIVPTFTSNPNDCLKFGAEKLKSTVEQCEKNVSEEHEKKIGEAYLKLAQYSTNCDPNEKDFMVYILRAMRMNSLEAKQLFPCILLDCDLFKYKEEFIREIKEIPTWMFLGWIPQLLANVDNEKVFALYDLLIRIAESYPQAIMYAYRLSKENFTKPEDTAVLTKMSQLIEKLDTLLMSDPTVDKFLSALSNVCVPPVYLLTYVDKMVKALSKKSMDKFEQIKQNALSNVYDSEPGSDAQNIKGTLYKHLTTFKKDIEKLSGNDSRKLLNSANVLLSKVKSFLTEKPKTSRHEKKQESTLLKDYCPWLANFSANKLNIEFEVPGQYDGSKKPLLQHHAKISRFHEHVSVMQSLRRPIKLTMLGMDTKEYPFLVKFGEDIRQDQRIEQLFALMNSIFQKDLTCSNKHLNILTYHVIPLTSNLGIIQWVNNTDSLENVIKKPFIKDEKVIKKVDKLIEDYYKFLGWTQTKKDTDLYGVAAKRFSRDKIKPFFNTLVYSMPLDAMKRSFWNMSTNTENFIVLRTNFIKTYGVMFIAHWILGIGDRHLENSKINTRNGKVLGIDFGHAFGTATQFLPVPELVPYRLTPHLLSFMEPFKEKGFLREYMIDALRALRENSGPLVATMNVFVKEPSMDWLEHASEFTFEEGSETDLQWFPNEKVNQVRKKLQGASSSSILIEDLEHSRLQKRYIESYVELVKGVEQFNYRARLHKDENLSVEEQVNCLLDHATDENLLGRMYGGWRPWI